MELVKRISALCLLFVFVLSTSGVSVYKHYCGNHLAAVSLFHAHNPCLDGEEEESCSMEQEMDCCDDEFQFYQLDVELQKVNAQSLSLNVELTAQESSRLLPLVEDIKLDQQAAEPKPPPLVRPPIYITSQQLIFYG